MLKLPTGHLNTLIDRVLAKRAWTGERLAKEMEVGSHTISRWRKDSGIHQVHYNELMRLDNESASADAAAIVPVVTPLRVPFSVTIPRNSLRVSTDKNGNIRIDGVLEALLNKEEG